MKTPVLNASGLQRLLEDGYQKKDLAQYFVISRPFLNRLAEEGVQPEHPGITLFINARIAHLLKSPA